jgi:prolyl-tRNA synthetase
MPPSRSFPPQERQREVRRGADKLHHRSHDGRPAALQSGTSHNLGQNFAKAFDIKYLDLNNELQYCWTTSWGLSTRFIGAMIMAHGDDKGLRLPPRMAPIQVVIVPIFKDEAEKTAVMDTVWRMKAALRDADIRVHVDDREGQTPGFKYNDWEMRGVPLRMEIGPKDVQKNSVALARRDIPGREGKQFVPQEASWRRWRNLLDAIQANMLKQATEFRDSNLTEVVGDYQRFGEIIESGGWALTWFSGDREEEQKIKEDFQCVSRCFPLEQPYPNQTGPSIVSGKPARRWPSLPARIEHRGAPGPHGRGAPLPRPGAKADLRPPPLLLRGRTPVKI